ncbi:hypothetical protein NA57DRAFT_73867 [Rhizodiscina lignyota]|uniref:Uncharacterized protein n=1 Tax=Rhizodiscina lignyota TaxID=1504668 RepID=A0A9P4MAD0_9PEZI|nr:hypothetical protein NA57DRAFT_73867 [Rhizodiscina lignyota]
MSNIPLDEKDGDSALDPLKAPDAISGHSNIGYIVSNFSNVDTLRGCDPAAVDHRSNLPTSSQNLLRDDITPPGTEPFENSNGSERAPHTVWATLRAWGLEICTWALGTGALLAIIILLAHFNDRPLEQWKSKVEFNTVVSVLSQVATPALLVSVQSCLGQLKWIRYRKRTALTALEVFDKASRGPQGSFELLWDIICPINILRSPRFSRVGRLHYSHLPALGALITLLMLAFQPFVQQSIKTPTSRQIEFYGGTVEIPRAINYQITVDQTELPFIRNTAAQDIGVAMEAAINDGLGKDTNSISQVTGDCWSQNCTFNPYTSLAFCSTVEDVSPTIITNCSIQNPNITTNCWYTLKALNNSVENTAEHGQPPSFDCGADLDTFIVSSVGRGTLGSGLNFSTESAEMVKIYVIYATNESLTNVGNEHNPVCNGAALAALQGSIHLCLQTFQTNITDGITHTRIVERHNGQNWSVSHFGNDGDTFTNHVSGDTTTFTTDANALNSLGDYLAKVVFSGSANLALQFGGDNLVDAGLGQFLLYDFVGKDLKSLSRNPSIDNFKARLNNVTVAMTNALREQTENGGTNPVSGIAYTSKQYRQIDFPWLIIPGVIWVLTTWLLIATMIRTGQRRVPLWKSSPLALLSSPKLLDGSDSLKGMEADAKNINVQLQKEGGNWQLEKVNGSRSSGFALSNLPGNGHDGTMRSRQSNG